VIGKKLDRPSITSWTEADPRLRFLSFDGVEIATAHEIETEGPADSLVRASEGTLISDISSPGRSGTLLAFDPGESNWPLRASFVLFVRNVVELARSHRARGITGPARTGEPLSVRVPPDVTEVEVEDPAQKKTVVPSRNGIAVVADVQKSGFYFVSWKGQRPGSVLVSANLTSETESDIRPKELAANKSVRVAEAKEMADAHTEWGWLLAALALLFIGLDAWWLTRKPAQRTLTTPRLPDRPDVKGRPA
jgi:hypothetical protein